MKLRLIISFILIVLISVFSVVFIFQKGTTNEIRSYVIRSGGWAVQGLISNLEDYFLLHNSWEGVSDLFIYRQRVQGQITRNQGMGFTRNMPGLRMRLADAQGIIVYDSSNSNAADKLNDIELSQAIPIHVEQEIVGYLLTEMSSELERRILYPLLSRINIAAFWAVIIAIILSLILAFFLAYELLRPINALTNAVGHLGRGDLSQRVDVHGNDELAELSRAFNRMAESLQQAEESRRAMTADIAHELRTPLAIQNAQLEAMRDEVYQLNIENIQSVLDQNMLLTRLVEDLRTLTLADTGQLKLVKTLIYLPELIEKIAGRFETQANSNHISIKRFTSGNFPQLYLDADRIEQILVNLLSNALRYTPDGGIISFELSFNSQEAIVTLHDNGPGIPDDAISHVFERFYRVDKGRGREEGGTGLGLTIARKLARIHGGEITAANHSLGGALFTLTLPLYGHYED